MGKKFLTALEVAEHLQVHVDTVYKLVQKGTLPGAKIVKQWRFDADDIRHWFATQTHPKKNDPEDTCSGLQMNR